MTTPPPSPNWTTIVACIMAIIGGALGIANLIAAQGALNQRVTQNTQRLDKLEASDGARTDAVNSINVRTARIEARLDFLISKSERQ